MKLFFSIKDGLIIDMDMPETHHQKTFNKKFYLVENCFPYLVFYILDLKMI